MISTRLFSKPAYGVDELLKIVPVGRSWLYQEIRAGRLRKTKFGRRTVFLVDDVVAWLEAYRGADGSVDAPHSDARQL